jgi:bifunctional non-homologous end joining protein LigD
MKESTISLYYKEGSSDKVYNVAIEAKNNGWVVNFQYGRRGAALMSGTKTKSPVNFDKAVKIMSLLVVEKQAKGYTLDTSGKAFMHTDKEATGIYPQLLLPVDEDQAKALLEDDNYVLQEKFDGHRKMIQKIGNKVKGINRKGYTVDLPPDVVDEVKAIDSVAEILDGEQIGDFIYVFDMPVTGKTFSERYAHLVALFGAADFRQMKLVASVEGTLAKKRMYASLFKANREGVVFKHKDSLYTPGKVKSAHTQYKYKFYETASFIVTGINDKASVQIAVKADNAILPVGNVTIPPNYKMPFAGDVIEVRYLYAYPGGSIYQPVYLGKRSDIDESECTVDQLKYKPDDKT